jgi:hypothetical protein
MAKFIDSLNPFKKSARVLLPEHFGKSPENKEKNEETVRVLLPEHFGKSPENKEKKEKTVLGLSPKNKDPRTFHDLVITILKDLKTGGIKIKTKNPKKPKKKN